MRRLSAKGLTLVEVMVAVGILLVGAVGALAAILSLVGLTNTSSLITLGASEAQYQMEQIRALPFASVASYSAAGTRLPNESINVVSSTLGIHLKEVTVTVSWLETGSTRTYALSTLIAE